MATRVYGEAFAVAAVIPNRPHWQAATTPVTYTDGTVPADSEIDAFTVVSIDPATGEISVLEDLSTGGIVGLIQSSVATEVGQELEVSVITGATVNPDGVTWHASLDTLAKRKAAVRQSAAPTDILLQETL